MSTSKIRIRKNCLWCGKEFEAQKTTTKYCCKRCSEHAYKENKRQERKNKAENDNQLRILGESQKSIEKIKFLSVIEAAKFLNITRDGIYKLIYRGFLPAYRLSSQWTVIKREDIEKMIGTRPYERKPRATSKKGKKYKLHFNKDKDGNIKGYSLSKGNLKYKASELGTSRNLTISNLKKTWYKFHPNLNPAFDYTRPAPGRIKTDVYSGSHREVRYIPEKVLNMFNQAFNESVCRGWRTKLGEALYNFAYLRANLSQISISHVISADIGSGENREFEINTSGDIYEAQIEYEMALQIIASLKAGISRSRSIGMSW